MKKNIFLFILINATSVIYGMDEKPSKSSLTFGDSAFSRPHKKKSTIDHEVAQLTASFTPVIDDLDYRSSLSSLFKKGKFGVIIMPRITPEENKITTPSNEKRNAHEITTDIVIGTVINKKID